MRYDSRVEGWYESKQTCTTSAVRLCSMLSFFFALGAPASAPCDITGEALDVISDTTLMCGAYGDPHIIKSSDAKVVNHMGTPSCICLLCLSLI